MSYQIVRQKKEAARRKLKAHYGTDPQDELDEETVAKLKEEIEWAEHMEEAFAE